MNEEPKKPSKERLAIIAEIEACKKRKERFETIQKESTHLIEENDEKIGNAVWAEHVQNILIGTLYSLLKKSSNE